MPRFYFDVHEEARFIPDDEGLELANLDRAEREAAKAAAEIGRDRLPSGDAREITIEVHNEHHRMVLAVMVSMRIKRVFPRPSLPSLERLGALAARGQRHECAPSLMSGTRPCRNVDVPSATYVTDCPVVGICGPNLT
jgi:hypothetical protein